MTMVYPRLARFLDATSVLGVSKMLWIAPRWLMRPVYHVLTRDLRRPLPDVSPGHVLYWTELTGADLAHVLPMCPTMSEAEIRRRWHEGQECLLCWSEGTLAHYRWYARHPVHLHYLGRTLRLLEGDYLASEAFTHPRFRGQGIHAFMGIWGLHRAKALGFTRCIGIIASWNAPSLQSSQLKTGYTLVGTVGYWNLILGRFDFATGDVCLEGAESFYVRL